MYISTKALALVAIATAGSHAYKTSPQPAKTVSRASFLEKAGAAGAAFLVSASAGVLPTNAAGFDSPQQWDNANSGRGEYSLNRDGSYDSRMNRSMQRGANQNFGNREVMERNMQGNSLASANRYDMNSIPKVMKWPDNKYLVPIQELDNSLAMLKREVNSNKGVEGIESGYRMMENFFQKTNNRKAFEGLASVYAKNIQFQDPTSVVARDFERSFTRDADETVSAMQQVRSQLKTLANKGADRVTPEVLASINRAQNGVKDILNKVPQADADKARSVAKNTNFKNGNAWLEGDQMDFLASNQKNVYSSVAPYV